MDGEVGGGGSQTQKVQIQELLTALGITRVVNVDDELAEKLDSNWVPSDQPRRGRKPKAEVEDASGIDHA